MKKGQHLYRVSNDLKLKFFCTLSETLKNSINGKNVLFGVKAFDTFGVEPNITIFMIKIDAPKQQLAQGRSFFLYNPGIDYQI